MRTLYLIAISCLALAVGPCYGQSGVCNAKYACISSFAFVECSGNEYTNVSPTTLCPSGTICLAGSTSQDPNNMCVATSPPPLCTSAGIFRVPGRCRDYYVCANNGGTVSLVRYGECAKGDYEFSSALGHCVSTALAGCSVPAPASTTTRRPSCTPLSMEADPDSCRHFYRCTLLGQRQRTPCLPFMFYDINTRLCKFYTECGLRPRS